jgi:hypothetical protein
MTSIAISCCTLRPTQFQNRAICVRILTIKSLFLWVLCRHFYTTAWRINWNVSKRWPYTGVVFLGSVMWTYITGTCRSSAMLCMAACSVSPTRATCALLNASQCDASDIYNEYEARLYEARIWVNSITLLVRNADTTWQMVHYLEKVIRHQRVNRQIFIGMYWQWQRLRYKRVLWVSVCCIHCKLSQHQSLKLFVLWMSQQQQPSSTIEHVINLLNCDIHCRSRRHVLMRASVEGLTREQMIRWQFALSGIA